MIDNRRKATDTAKRKPWMKWYTSDWRAEPTLRMVTRGARSVWVDLLGLMHESTLIGSLLLNGRIPTHQDLAKVLGDDPQKLAEWMDELKEAGVYSVDEDGTIYSRKMRHAAEISEKGRKDVTKRGGAWAPGKKKAAPKRNPKGDPNRGAIGDPTTQRLDTRTKKEEPEPTSEVVTSVSSNPEIQSPEEPLLVCEDRKPLPATIPDPKPISSKINRGERWPSNAIVPDDWILEAAEYLRVNGLPQIDLKLSADTFQDYWPAQPGANGLKLDWRATWRNWVRNDAKRTKGYSNGKGQYGQRGALGNHPGGKFAALRERLSPDGESRKTFDA